MRRNLPVMSALRAFEAAARHVSFKRAAAELAVTPTAVSHQVRRLEADLGVMLFVRRVRQVELTDPGRILYSALARAFDTMAEGVEAVKRPVRQTATLSATIAFTARRLVPIAAGFRIANPGWELRLHASDDPVDLPAGEADAAIRYGDGDYPGLAVMPLASDAFAPVCSPRLGPIGPGDIGATPLIHFEWRRSGRGVTRPDWSAWARQAGLRLDGQAPGLTFSDENSAIHAAVAGQGLALLSTTLVEAELSSGALIQPFGPSLDGYRYDLVFPEGGEDAPARQALRRWLEPEFAKRL